MYYRITNISDKTLTEKNNMPCKGLIYEVNGHYIRPGKSVNILISSLSDIVRQHIIDDHKENNIIEVVEIKENSSLELNPERKIEPLEVKENTLSESNPERKIEADIQPEDEKFRKKK